jgi:hypothetical protein
MKLWLDDIREPAKHGCAGWTWAKTADEAIDYLKTGTVTEASLDHDLSFEHYELGSNSGYKEKTGYDVILWMEENNVWPKTLAVHSMNPVGAQRMLGVAKLHCDASRRRVSC